MENLHYCYVISGTHGTPVGVAPNLDKLHEFFLYTSEEFLKDKSGSKYEYLITKVTKL